MLGFVPQPNLHGLRFLGKTYAVLIPVRSSWETRKSDWLLYLQYGSVNAWISELLMTGLTAVAIQRPFVQNAQLPGRVSQFR
jgi:hypothetical protein